MVVFSKVWRGVAVASGILAVVAFVRAYRYVRELRGTFKEMGLQELPQKGWLGGWALYKERKEDLFGLEQDLINEYGKVFGYFEGRHPAIMVADPMLVKQVMVTDHDHFVDRRIFFASRRKPIDLQLTTLTGERWKHVRQQLTPAFTPANLRRMGPLLSKVADQFVANIKRQADNGQPFDAKECCGFYTMDAIASVAFALEIDSFNNQNNPFVARAKQVFQAFPLTGNLFAMMLMFPDYFISFLKVVPLLAAVAKVFEFFQDVVVAEMDRRIKTGENSQRRDFLSQVMPLERDPKDPANEPYVRYDEFGGVWLTNGLTRDEILGQAVLFFLAGYETTSNALTMVLLALSLHSDVQEKLFTELQAAFGEGQAMTIDSLNEVKYLDMVINETLRCYCPVLRVDRLCTAETVLNGMTIPKGVLMIIPINALHRDPEYWHEPDRFDPERFSAENEDSFPKDSFIPFGIGNRNCIGMRLALLELKIALARLVLEFSFKLSPETDMPIRWLPTPFRNPHCKVLLEPKQRLK